MSKKNTDSDIVFFAQTDYSLLLYTEIELN